MLQLPNYRPRNQNESSCNDLEYLVPAPQVTNSKTNNVKTETDGTTTNEQNGRPGVPNSLGRPGIALECNHIVQNIGIQYLNVNSQRNCSLSNVQQRISSKNVCNNLASPPQHETDFSSHRPVGYSNPVYQSGGSSSHPSVGASSQWPVNNNATANNDQDHRDWTPPPNATSHNASPIRRTVFSPNSPQLHTCNACLKQFFTREAAEKHVIDVHLRVTRPINPMTSSSAMIGGFERLNQRVPEVDRPINTITSSSAMIGGFERLNQRVPEVDRPINTITSSSAMIGGFERLNQRVPEVDRPINTITSSSAMIGGFESLNQRVSDVDRPINTITSSSAMIGGFERLNQRVPEVDRPINTITSSSAMIGGFESLNQRVSDVDRPINTITSSSAMIGGFESLNQRVSDADRPINTITSSSTMIGGFERLNQRVPEVDTRAGTLGKETIAPKLNVARKSVSTTSQKRKFLNPVSPPKVKPPTSMCNNNTPTELKENETKNRNLSPAIVSERTSETLEAEQTLTGLTAEKPTEVTITDVAPIAKVEIDLEVVENEAEKPVNSTCVVETTASSSNVVEPTTEKANKVRVITELVDLRKGNSIFDIPDDEGDLSASKPKKPRKCGKRGPSKKLKLQKRKTSKKQTNCSLESDVIVEELEKPDQEVECVELADDGNVNKFCGTPVQNLDSITDSATEKQNAPEKGKCDSQYDSDSRNIVELETKTTDLEDNSLQIVEPEACDHAKSINATDSKQIKPLFEILNEGTETSCENCSKSLEEFQSVPEDPKEDAEDPLDTWEQIDLTSTEIVEKEAELDAGMDKMDVSCSQDKPCDEKAFDVEKQCKVNKNVDKEDVQTIPTENEPESGTTEAIAALDSSSSRVHLEEQEKNVSEISCNQITNLSEVCESFINSISPFPKPQSVVTFLPDKKLDESSSEENGGIAADTNECGLETNSSDSVKCEVCGAMLASNLQYLEHFQRMHIRKRKRAQSLTDSKPECSHGLVCRKCKRTFARKNGLALHTKSCKFVCNGSRKEYCKRVEAALTAKKLKSEILHFRRKYPPTNLICSKSNKYDPSSVRCIVEMGRAECSSCDVIFSNISNLVEHVIERNPNCHLTLSPTFNVAKIIADCRKKPRALRAASDNVPSIEMSSKPAIKLMKQLNETSKKLIKLLKDTDTRSEKVPQTQPLFCM